MNAVNNSHKKVVLFISHSSENYGAQNSLLTLINNLPIEIIPVVLFPSKGIALQKLNEGIQKYILFYLPWLSSRKKFVKSIVVSIVNNLALLKVSKICREHKVDLIYSNTLANPLGLLVSKKMKLPHIVHIREYIGIKENVCFVSSERKSLNYLRKYSSTIICNSHSVASFYKAQMQLPKVSVIYNGINCPENCERKPNSNVNTLLMVGYLEGRKNQEEAIYAVKLLKEKNVIVNLILAGGGDKEYIQKLKKYVESEKLERDVTFAGNVTNVSAMYASSMCLVHCAKREPWGRVIVEAMLNRCPVISADSDGAKEIITDTVNGFLYKTGDIHQLSDLIQKVITQNIDIKCIVDTAYMEAREKYSVKRYVTEVSNIIYGLLQK